MTLEREYRVTFENKDRIIYSEPGRSVGVDLERLVGDAFDVVVYLSSVRLWNTSSERVCITQEELGDIRDRITNTFPKIKFDWA